MRKVISIAMVSYLADADRGGQVNLLRLVRGLDTSRFECTVLVPGEGTMEDAVRHAGSKVMRLRLRHPRNSPIRGSLAIVRLHAFLKRYKPDILYVDGADHVCSAALAARGTSTRVIWHLQTSFETRHDLPNTRQAHVVVCCADNISARLRKLNPNADIRTIYNAVDTARFFPGKAPELRAALGVTPDNYVFLYVGGLTRLKGTDDLIQAFTQVYAANKRARLWIAGDGEDREKLKKACTTAGIKSAVQMLGVRTDVEMLMRASNCFVFPSHSEGLPLTLLEALATGCPIIATNIPGNLQARPPDSTPLVPPKDPHALAQAMLAHIPDPTTSTPTPPLNPSLLERRFHLDHYIDAFAQLFTDQTACLSP